MVTTAKGPLVAVIGGSGFVGGEVLRQLHALGRAAINIDIAPPAAELLALAPFRPADLTDAASLVPALAGCDSIIYLAAEWRDNVRPLSRYTAINVDGTRNLIAAADANGITRCIFTSSASVYGPTTHEADEDYAKNPINPYGRSKLEGEAVLREWAAAHPGVALTMIRPTVIFGPGNRGNVYNLLRQIARGPFVMIGDGTNRKSMAYVENVAAFHVHCLALGPGVHVFNYADKPDPTMNDLVASVAQALGRPAAGGVRVPRGLALAGGRLFDAASRLLGREFGITSERVFKFCANTQYAATAALATGFTPPVALDEALRRTIAADFGAEPR